MMMRGFMCQSPAATAVCMSRADARSVMVPRRSSTSSLNNNFDINFNRTHYTRSLLNSNKYYYSRLLTSPPPPHHVHDHGKISPLLIMPSTSKQVGADHHHDLLPLTHQQPMSSKTIEKRPSSHSDSVLPSSADDNVFQVKINYFYLPSSSNFPTMNMNTIRNALLVIYMVRRDNNVLYMLVVAGGCYESFYSLSRMCW